MGNWGGERRNWEGKWRKMVNKEGGGINDRMGK